MKVEIGVVRGLENTSIGMCLAEEYEKQYGPLKAKIPVENFLRKSLTKASSGGDSSPRIQSGLTFANPGRQSGS
jgi:hypothetical protein